MEDKIRIALSIDKAVMKEFKIACIKNDVFYSSTVEDFMKEYVKENK